MLEHFLVFLFTVNAACGATHHEFLQWGLAGAGKVESAPVPLGTVWVVRAGGVFTNNPTAADYMMEIVHPVWSQSGACCWRVPVARSDGAVQGTPVLALSRPIVLGPGDKLSGRTNSIVSPNQIGLTFLYYQLPESCLAGIQLP